MADDPIPDDVRRFILAFIDSIAHLEALLLLYGRREPEWTVPEVAQRLYISEEQTGGVLARLVSDGLVASPAGPPTRFVYRPGSAELDQAVERVADTYRHQLVPVTNLVHSKPKTRIREFADAFRIRKDD
jgi:hypothetical protein